MWVGVNDSVFQVATYSVPVDQRPHQPLGVLADSPKSACVFFPEHLSQREHVLTLSTAQLTAVSARGAPPHPVGFQHHHIAALLRQVQAAGQSGIARADDANIGPGITLQRVISREFVCAGGVVGIRVAFDPHTPPRSLRTSGRRISLM